MIFLCVPAIEVPDNADAIRGRRPDGERDAALAFVRDRVRSELVVDTQMLAFAEEMEIEITESWCEFAAAIRSSTVGERSPRERALAYARASDTLRLCAFA